MELFIFRKVKRAIEDLFLKLLKVPITYACFTLLRKGGALDLLTLDALWNK